MAYIKKTHYYVISNYVTVCSELQFMLPPIDTAYKVQHCSVVFNEVYLRNESTHNGRSVSSEPTDFFKNILHSPRFQYVLKYSLASKNMSHICVVLTW